MSMPGAYTEEVIITMMEKRGKGVESDPVRRITQVFAKDGKLIAERDRAQPELLNAFAKKLTKELADELQAIVPYRCGG